MPESTAPDELFLAFQQAVAGRYFIDREIGRGGMGVVYLAREVQLDRMVAIKLLPPRLAAQPDLLARFVAEARLAARLSHPNIVPIHAVDVVSGFVFIVMALVDGITLSERVRTRGPLSASEGARVLREVAYALEYAHGHGVVHRDVKPENILIERATGRALVADFGIAAAVGDDAASRGLGTPAYMSPEQALGLETDARSDIYSLGATAYYALSGRLPFEGDTPDEVLRKQMEDAPAPLHSLGLAVTRRLAQLIDRCLAKDPARRPATAQAVAEQLGIAMEQRREVPAVLRGFVKRNGRTSDSNLVLAYGGLSSVIAISAAYFDLSGATTALLVAGGFAAVQVAFLADAARRVLKLGFSQPDLRPAFAAELEASREEYAVSPDASYLRVARGANALGRLGATYIGIAAPLTLFALRTGVERGLAEIASPLLWVAGAMAAWGFGVDLGLRRLRGDVDTKFWARVWNGRIGKFAFAIARRLQRGTPVVSAVTHRATELSLGMAAEQLYEQLPRATRRTLKSLPSLLGRLQDDAQALRARFDALSEAVAGSGAAADSESLAAVRTERDIVQGRLREAVGALETIRLNLLRLHAGQASVEALTTQIEVARALSADVRRLIEAREEAAAALEYPARPQPTPV